MLDIRYRLFGNRTIRKRAWCVAFHAERLREDVETCASWIRDIERLVHSLEVELPDLNTCILPEGDPWLDLVRCEKQRQVPDNENESEWTSQLSNLLSSKKHVWRDLQPPTGATESIDFQSLTRRQKMTLNFQLLMTPGCWSVDIGQTIGRSPHQTDELFNSFTGTALPYVVPLNRVLTGKECMMVHGFPSSMLSCKRLTDADVSDSLLRDLAANSFSSGAILAVLISLFEVVPISVWCDTDVSDICSVEEPDTLVESILEM